VKEDTSQTARATVQFQSHSLAHFLIHGQDGRYKASFRSLIERGGLPADFKQLIGSYDEIEPLWHAHLLRLKAQAARQ